MIGRTQRARRFTARRGAAVAVAVAVAVTAGAPAAASAAPLGALDPAFGGGVVTLPAGTQLNAAAMQGDGNVVVTGLIGGMSNRRLLVARVTPTGVLDPAFAGGIVTGPLPSGATGVIGQAVTVQADGKIVVAGDIRRPTGADGMLVARLNPNGSLDGGFGSGGVATVLFGSGVQASAAAIAVKPTGEIVVGGAAINGSGGPTAALARFSTTGSPLGVSYLDIGEAAITGIALQPDGKIVLSGSRKVDQLVETFVARTDASGAKDAAFAGGGVVARQLARNGAARSTFEAVALQPDGKIVAAGAALDGAGGETPGALRVTARYDAAGNPDPSFGPDGVRYLPGANASAIDSSVPMGNAGVIVDSGHIYTAGSWQESALSVLAVSAHDGAGNPDGAFGSGGSTVTPVQNYAVPAFGMALALSPHGLYVAGTTGSLTEDTTTGVIARYGAYPFSFPLPPPPPPPPPPPTVRLTGASLSPKPIRGRRGKTTLRFTLSAAGTVRLTVERPRLGRRRGARCERPSARNRKGRRCTFYVRVGGTRTLRGKAGVNTITLTRKVTTTTLKPGKYRLVLQVLRGGKPTGPKRIIALTVR